MPDLNNDLEARRAAAMAFAEAAEYLENLNLDLVELEEDGEKEAPCQK